MGGKCNKNYLKCMYMYIIFQLLFAPPFLAYFLSGMEILKGEGLDAIKNKLKDVSSTYYMYTFFYSKAMPHKIILGTNKNCFLIMSLNYIALDHKLKVFKIRWSYYQNFVVNIKEATTKLSSFLQLQPNCLLSYSFNQIVFFLTGLSRCYEDQLHGNYLRSRL